MDMISLQKQFTMQKTNKTNYLNAHALMQGICTPDGSPTSFFPKVEIEGEEWIDANRIYKLWQIAYSWGVFIPLSSPPTVAYSDKYVAIYVTNDAITVQLQRKKGTQFKTMLLKNGLTLQWDPSLTLLGIDNWIINTYQKAEAKKLMLSDVPRLVEKEIMLIQVPSVVEE